MGGDSLIDYIPNKYKKRIELGLPIDAFILISVGELNINKNNKVIIKALQELEDKKIHYLLCGVGDMELELKKFSNICGIDEQIHFLGYRNDMRELFKAADVFVLPSLREGLPRSLMEAMACGLPCVVSDIRGNRDLIKEDLGGYLRGTFEAEEFAKCFAKLLNSQELRNRMSQYNLNVINEYDINVVKRKMEYIYKELFNCL